MRIISLLAAGIATLAFAACGADDTTTTTVVQTVTEPAQTAPTTGTTSTATTPAGPPRSLREFRSPSGNIGCVVGDSTVRCDVRSRNWQPPSKPADCELDWGSGIAIDAGGAPAFVCAGDTALNQGEVLKYGETNEVGLLRCASTPAAMVCRDVESGRGFSISRDSYKLF